MSWTERGLAWGSAVLVAGVLIFAGLDKLFHYDGFLRALESYVLVPDGAEAYLALPLILMELVVGVALLVPAWRRRAAAAAAVLLATFTVAVVVNRQLVPEAPCGCTFTLTLGDGDGVHVALNLLLVAVAAGLALDRPDRSTVDPGRVPTPTTHPSGD